MIRYYLTDLEIVLPEEVWAKTVPLSVPRWFFDECGGRYVEGAVVLCPYANGQYLMEVDPITRESTGRRQQFRLVVERATS